MPKEAKIVGGVQFHNLYKLFLDQFFMLISKIILILNHFQYYYGYLLSGKYKILKANFEPFQPHFKPIWGILNQFTGILRDNDAWYLLLMVSSYDLYKNLVVFSI